MNYRCFAVACLIIFPAQLGFATGPPTVDWEVFNSQDGLVGDRFLQVFEDTQGSIWCASVTGGVSKYDGREWTNFRKNDGLISDSIRRFFSDSQGNTWLFGSKGRFSRHDQVNMKKGERIYAGPIIEDSKRQIWLGSLIEPPAIGKSSGVYIFSTEGSFKHITKKRGLSGNVITIFFEDSNGYIWVGTTEGISRFSGDAWTSYNKKNGLTSKTVTTILEDSKGDIWVGTHGGLFRFHEETWTRFTKENGTFPTNDVLLLRMDSKGAIWVGLGGHSKEWGLISVASDLAHKSGILRFDGENWDSFTGEEGSPPGKVIKIEIDDNDNIWCDSYTSGFYMYDGEVWKKYSKEDGFYANHFNDFEQDSLGNIWLATNNGLLFFDGHNWTQFSLGSGLFAENIYSVIEDSRGDIWIATSNGVGRLRR